MTSDIEKQEKARERQRRFRERQLRGAIVRPFELCPDHIEAMIEFGYLDVMSADNPDAIDAAFQKAMDDWLGTGPVVTRHAKLIQNKVKSDHAA